MYALAEVDVTYPILRCVWLFKISGDANSNQQTENLTNQRMYIT